MTLIISRVMRGAAHNFTLRVGDWFMASVLGSFGIILSLNREPVTSMAAWKQLWAFATPVEWGMLCMAGALIRLLALIVNGTFPGFPWTPHIRLVGCFLSCFLWFQLVLGLFATSAVVPGWAFYPHLLVFEVYNLFVAGVEAGQKRRGQVDG